MQFLLQVLLDVCSGYNRVHVVPVGKQEAVFSHLAFSGMALTA